MKRKVRINKFVHIDVCDICGTEAKHKCFICGKDLCSKCVVWESDEDTDYTGKYCQSCWDAGERFRSEIEKVTEWYSDEVFATKEAWKEFALRK